MEDINLSPSEISEFLTNFTQGLSVLERTLLSEPLTAKGQDFPTVQGPRCRGARIGIVGAGLAGIHMALELKRAGFKDVTILEKSNRIGGRIQDVVFRNVTHSYGPGFFTDYDIQ